MRHRGITAALALLVASVSPLAAQGFGRAVAVSGDQLIVGQPFSSMTPGSVFLFTSDGGTWTETGKLNAPDAETGDRFGSAVVVDGSTLAIGASGAQHGDLYQTGVVYLMERDASGGWSRAGHVMVDGSPDDGVFGAAVALEGDHLFVSNATASAGGVVYAFERDGDDWAEIARLTSPEGTAGFGGSLTLSGDLLAVGAVNLGFGFRRGGGGGHPGAVYLFRRDADGVWRQEARISPDDLENGASFGSSVKIVEGHLLIGAPGLERRTGAVFAFARDEESGEWSQAGTFRPFDAPRSGQFGMSIFADEDEVWIGAPGAEGSQGRVYRILQDLETGSFTSAVKLSPEADAGRDQFGAPFAIAGDLAVVAAPGDDYRAGTAYVFERGPDGVWTSSQKIWADVETLDPVTGGEVKCEEGGAVVFDCNQVDMLAYVPVPALGAGRGVSVNDIWGWRDPQTGREYALVGLTDQASFVDITDPENPVYVGRLKMSPKARGSMWRDIKVYKDHAFIVSDGAGEHGMQVFDLAHLRDVGNAPVDFEEAAHYDGIFSAHNIVINEETGYAYSVGSSGGGTTCGGGLHMINIQEPTQPTFAGCFGHEGTGRSGTGYSHDAMCIVYNGPDAEHVGKEICFGSNERQLSISDVSDKDSPVGLAAAGYPNVGYAHQGWITQDHKYFFMNDELDEIADARQEGGSQFTGTRTMIWDVSDLDDPIMIKEHFGETLTADHNLYVRDNLMYQSNYNSGLRILDISDPENPVEVAFFDTVPYAESPSMGGSWSNFPFFESGTIIVTSMSEGLFLLKKAEPQLVP